MSERQKATLQVQRISEGRYEWVIVAISEDIGTMPQRKRSVEAYPTEEAARQAGERELESMRTT